MSPKFAAGLLFLLLGANYPAHAAADAEAEVRAAVAKFGIAFRNADVPVLEQMLTADYVHTNGGSGSRIGSDQWLEWVASQRELLNSGQLRIDNYDVQDLEIEVYGDSAFVTGVVTTSGVRKGQPFIGSVRFSNLWVWEQGDWRRAAFHDSPITLNLPHAFDAGWEGLTTCELLYETDEVRVGRCEFPPGVGHEKHYHNPHFGYVIEGSTLRIRDSSGEREVETIAGTTWSTDAITVHEALNVGDTSTSYLIVEPVPSGR